VKVIVIGAGIIGVSIADRLASAGASVTVLDMRGPGQGASQASAGMLAPYTEAHGHDELLALGIRSLAMFDRLVSELEQTTGRQIEYHRTGTLEVAFDETHRGRLVRAHQALAAAGVDNALLDASELRRREPAAAATAAAALLTVPHGFVGVESLLSALVHRARFSGVVFVTPAESLAVEERGKSVQVRVGDHVEVADYTVIAAGCWSGRVRVKHKAALPVRPVRGQLLHLRWNGGRPGGIVWGPRCYVVPWSDGTVLVGATVEEAGFDEHATAEGVRELTDAVIELLPGARSARFGGVRVGLRPAVPDGLPVIGPLADAPRIVVATGHYRNGVLLAPVTAEIVVRHILEGVNDDALKITSPARLMS
jgi:glycine oxidase